MVLMMNKQKIAVYGDENGFTIIELIVTIVLSGIVIIILAITFTAGIQGLGNVMSQKRLMQEGELGLAKFSREATLINQVVTASATQFSFTTNQFPGITIDYQIDTQGLFRRYNGGSYNAMVANIDAGSSSFSYFDINGNVTGSVLDVHRVHLSLAMQHGDQNFILTTDVFPVTFKFEES
jgi:type II secretory pathway pseudopilin PulG